MDKSWVWLPRTSLEYHEGASSFVSESAKRLGNPEEMLCPCMHCRNVCHQSRETVVDHLVMRGMDQKYKRRICWILHGELISDNTADEARPELEAHYLFRAAFGSEGKPENHDEYQSEYVESNEESEFRKKLEDAETPLYSSCPTYTKVSAIMALYRIKVKSGMSENFFDQLLTIVHDMLPEDNVLPTSTDGMKKFLKIFGFGYDVIHACKNDCILYRKEYENMVSCTRCNASRWERDKHSGEEKKGIPAKVLRYFPIKDRFKRLFRSKRLAENLQWHFNNATEDGTMRHPVDSTTWAQVNSKWPQFAAEPRNLRLGLSTDGMNPFSIQNTKYSTWPVLLVNYNMPPTICMKTENIMLTMLIPGPTAPGNSIDVYLEPLVDDLNDMWNDGIEVYDSFMKETFTLKAMLLWTISDYHAHVKNLEAQQADLLRKFQDFHNEVKNQLATGIKIDDASRAESREVNQDTAEGTWCQILDWYSLEDVVVGEGEFCSVDPVYKIGRIAIGPNAAAIYLKSATLGVASLWRPTSDANNVGEALGTTIPWPPEKVKVYKEASDNNPTSSSTVNESMDKIYIYGWNLVDTIVAEGRMVSTDPTEIVNNIPIGPNAAVVMVEMVIEKNACLWRPSTDLRVIGDALHERIVWPLDKVDPIIGPSIRSSHVNANSNNTSSTQSGQKKK